MTELGGSDRVLRSGASGALIVLAAVAIVVGAMAIYVRAEVLDSRAFANRTVKAVQKEPVQQVVAREVVVQLLERGSPDLLAARPVLQSVIASVIGSRQFAGLIRIAADHAHRLLFQRSAANVAFDLADAGTVVTSALRTLAPSVASRVPRRFLAVLLTMRRRSFAAQTLRIADKLRLLALILPPLALVLLALGMILAPNRRTAIVRLGIAVAVIAAIGAVALELSRLYLTSHVIPPPELTTAGLGAAVGGLWDAYFGDLMRLLIWTAVLSLFLALVASAVLAPYSATAGIKRGWAVARRLARRAPRAAVGALSLALAVLVAADPIVALRAAEFVVVVVLVYFGMGELLSGTAPRRRRVRRRSSRRVRAVAVAGAAALAAVGAALADGLSWGTPSVRAGEVQTCNGYAQLCSRRLDQVVFAGTHNSMSAADSPGWLIANQDRNVAQQLQDGIRLFKISTHYGVQDSSGHVRSDLKAAGDRLNRVSGKLSPQAREALQRLGGALGLGSLKGKRDIFLCHTLCELGATRMVDFLGTIRRFIDLNPGQVIVLFDEDYVAEKDVESAFRRAGLFSHLATLQPGKPLPTLGQLIHSGHNVLVFSQKPASGLYPWNMNASTWIQDTPLGAVKPSQFTCKPYRGRISSPLLMMNDWADVFPPRVSPNIPLVTRQFILHRASQCRAQRDHIPNLILTDFYDRGDVVGAVRELNGLGNEPPAPTLPVT